MGDKTSQREALLFQGIKKLRSNQLRLQLATILETGWTMELP